MIRLIDVHKEYENGTEALRGMDLRIDDGEFVFLVGPSGSGKSTIIKLLTGEVRASSGRVMVNAGAKPYITVKIPKGKKALDTIREALSAMQPEGAGVEK